MARGVSINWCFSQEAFFLKLFPAVNSEESLLFNPSKELEFSSIEEVAALAFISIAENFNSGWFEDEASSRVQKWP